MTVTFPSYVRISKLNYSPNSCLLRCTCNIINCINMKAHSSNPNNQDKRFLSASQPLLSHHKSSSEKFSAEGIKCEQVELDTTPEHEEEDHHGSSCYNAIFDFISLVLALSEIGLVIYLSYRHFEHQQGLIAIAVLGPIVLNFVGVIYFLSNKEERMEFERVSHSRLGKDIFQVPVLGPIFTAFKIFLISAGISKQGNYHRFEASAIKMKQAESFFQAAPEAIIQLSVLLTSEENENLTIDRYLEIVVVVLSVLTLSEAHMYGMISNYYKIFHTYEYNSWRLPKLSFGKRAILFGHTFTSIASRITAMSMLIAAVNYMCMLLFGRQSPAMSNSHAMSSTTTESTKVENVSPRANTVPAMTTMAGHGASEGGATPQDFAVMIVALILFQMLFHCILYYIARSIKHCILKSKSSNSEIPSGCYEAINYGWRATILDFGFYSKNILVQIWFYLENVLCFALWWFTVQKFNLLWVQRFPFSPMSGLFLLLTSLSLFFLFGAKGLELHHLRGPLSPRK